MQTRRWLRTWSLPGALAVVFVLVGALKLLEPASTATFFGGFGYPDGFGFVVGAAEVTGGLLLLGRRVRAFGARLRFWGACLLCTIMVGAVTTMLIHGSLVDVALPLVLGVIAARVAWTSRPPASDHLARRKGLEQHA